MRDSEVDATPDAQRRNHTLIYQRELFSALRSVGGTALDIGCGEGIAARELAARGYAVVGVDTDGPSLERARGQSSDGIEYVHADVMTATLDPCDVVFAGAMLHHVDLHDGLARFASLVRPGGQLLVVGLARSRGPVDLFLDGLAAVRHRIMFARSPAWEHGAPTVWPPPNTFDEVRRAVGTVLPGARFRRRLLWRYTIEWHRPATDQGSTNP